MPTRLTCPTCGTSLTVADAAPANLTCPKCLGAIHNPLVGSPTPLPVLPLDYQSPRVTGVDTQAKFDLIVTIGAIIVLLCLLAAGTAIPQLHARFSAFTGWDFPISIGILLGLIVGLTLAGRSKAPSAKVYRAASRGLSSVVSLFGLFIAATLLLIGFLALVLLSICGGVGGLFKGI